MLKKIAVFGLVFLLSLLVFLLATLPANLLWQKVLASQLPVKQLGIKVLAVDGTVWDGRVHLSYRKLEGILDWDIQFSDLLSMEIPMDLTMESHLGEVEGSLAVSPNTIELSLPKADLSLPPVNRLLRRQRVTLDGGVLINNLRVKVEDQKIVFAEGRGSWSGGNIAYPVGRKIHERSMPAFFAKLETLEGGVVRVGIKDADADFDVIDATLNREGEGFVQVKRRLLDLADEPARHKNETDVVFKVKKPLY